MWQTNPAYGNTFSFEHICDDSYDRYQTNEKTARGDKLKQIRCFMIFKDFLKDHKRDNNIFATGAFLKMSNINNKAIKQ